MAHNDTVLHKEGDIPHQPAKNKERTRIQAYPRRGPSGWFVLVARRLSSKPNKKRGEFK